METWEIDGFRIFPLADVLREYGIVIGRGYQPAHDLYNERAKVGTPGYFELATRTNSRKYLQEDVVASFIKDAKALWPKR